METKKIGDILLRKREQTDVFGNVREKAQPLQGKMEESCSSAREMKKIDGGKQK